MITALLFMVAPPYMVGEGYLFLRIDISRETPLAMAGRTGMSGGNTFVWLLSFSRLKVSKATKTSRVNL